MEEQEPSILYPIGATIEDPNAIMKIERFRKDRHGNHLYWCEILRWKIEPPAQVKANQSIDKIWVWIRPESIEKIKVIE